MAKLVTAIAGPADAPLLVVLHGRAETTSHALELAERFDPTTTFRVLAPRAPSPVPGGYSWFPTWGERTARHTIRQLQQAITDHCTDAGRDSDDCIVLGFSEGAAMALALGHAEPSTACPQAIIALAGFWPRGLSPRAVPRTKRTLIIHGDRDDTVPPDTATALSHQLATPDCPVDQLTFDGGHHAPTIALAHARAWLDSRDRIIGK